MYNKIQEINVDKLFNNFMNESALKFYTPDDLKQLKRREQKKAETPMVSAEEARKRFEKTVGGG